MPLESYRQRVEPHIGRLARPFMGWPPHRLTWTSFALSGAAAVTLASLRLVPSPLARLVPGLFFLAASFLFVGGVFDVLDGHVARRRRLASPQGDFLDHTLDRYSDTVVLLGLSLSGWVDPWLTLLALVSLLLVSYLGTQAQASLGQRLYAGWLGRADRIVILTGSFLAMSVLTALELTLPPPFRPWLGVPLGPFSVTWLDWVMLYFVVAGQVTAYGRARWIWVRLGTGSSPPLPALRGEPVTFDSSSPGVDAARDPGRSTDGNRPSP